MQSQPEMVLYMDQRNLLLGLLLIFIFSGIIISFDLSLFLSFFHGFSAYMHQPKYWS